MRAQRGQTLKPSSSDSPAAPKSAGSIMAAAVFGAKKAAEKRDAKQPRTVFEKYDADKSGKLDKDELLGAFRDLGVRVKLKELEVFVRHYGKNDKIKFEAFEKLLIAMQDMEDEKEADLERQYGVTGSVNQIPYQKEMIGFYNHPAVVYSVAAIIISNFLLNIVEKEVDPMGKPALKPTWDAIDAIFNIIFLIELIMNMYQYAGPKKRFWYSPWNWFDTFIVSVGVMLMIGGDSMPESLKRLKLLRALRVFRLFKRVKSLNKIIVALIASIPGVMNAFIIMVSEWTSISRNAPWQHEPHTLRHTLQRRGGRSRKAGTSGS